MLTPNVEMIGIGVPSVVDAARGIVYDVANIPSWKEVHLKEILEDEFHVPVYVDNDVELFRAWWEKILGQECLWWLRGHHAGYRCWGGIIIGGHLYRGANTGAGEVGALPYLDSDYEHYCSSMFPSTAAPRQVNNSQQKPFPEMPPRSIYGGSSGFHLGKLFCRPCVFTYDPQAVIIGGGITAAACISRSHAPVIVGWLSLSKEVQRADFLFHVEGCNMLGASRLNEEWWNEMKIILSSCSLSLKNKYFAFEMKKDIRSVFAGGDDNDAGKGCAHHPWVLQDGWTVRGRAHLPYFHTRHGDGRCWAMVSIQKMCCLVWITNSWTARGFDHPWSFCKQFICHHLSWLPACVFENRRVAFRQIYSWMVAKLLPHDTVRGPFRQYMPRYHSPYQVSQRVAHRIVAKAENGDPNIGARGLESASRWREHGHLPHDKSGNRGWCADAEHGCVL